MILHLPSMCNIMQGLVEMKDLFEKLHDMYVIINYYTDFDFTRIQLPSSSMKDEKYPTTPLSTGMILERTLLPQCSA